MSSWRGAIEESLFAFPTYGVAAMRPGTEFVVVHHESRRFDVAEWFEDAGHPPGNVWGEAMASTWNRPRAAGRLARLVYQERRLGDDDARRRRASPETPDETRAIDRAAIERLLTRWGVPLREKTLWCNGL